MCQTSRFAPSPPRVRGFLTQTGLGRKVITPARAGVIFLFQHTPVWIPLGSPTG